MSQNGTSLRNRHLGELISRLGTDAGTLVRQEIDLARAELQEQVDAARAEITRTVELARTETAEGIDAARTDLSAKAKAAGAGAGMFGVAGLTALLGLGALTAALVLVLDRVLPADVAALIVGVGWLFVAVVAALRGRARLGEVGNLDLGRYVPRRTVERVRENAKNLGNVKQALPEHTIESVKEDVQWVKTRGKSDAR